MILKILFRLLTLPLILLAIIINDFYQWLKVIYLFTIYGGETQIYDKHLNPQTLYKTQKRISELLDGVRSGYTGFKDSHGTKIYEGDMLTLRGTVHDYKEKVIVFWSESKGMWMCGGNQTEEPLHEIFDTITNITVNNP